MAVWKEALQLSSEIFKLSAKLPKCEDYGLTSQIRRSANSVNANIAEAFGRSTGPDKSRIYVFAKGSAYETQSHLIYGTSVGYFENAITNSLVDKYENLITSINKIIKTLLNDY